VETVKPASRPITLFFDLFLSARFAAILLMYLEIHAGVAACLTHHQLFGTRSVLILSETTTLARSNAFYVSTNLWLQAMLLIQTGTDTQGMEHFSTTVNGSRFTMSLPLHLGRIDISHQATALHIRYRLNIS
jgi:hypothetical protein